MTTYAATSGRIRQALADLERVVIRANHLFNKAQQSSDDDYLDGVALNLHGFYAGVEQIFQDIARSIGEGIPSGSEWHRDLLLQMSASIDSVRPSVITQQTRHCLDEYRGFRHVVRNVYTFNLRPSRLQELTEGLRECYDMTIRDLEEFANFLDRLSSASND